MLAHQAADVVQPSIRNAPRNPSTLQDAPFHLLVPLTPEDYVFSGDDYMEQDTDLDDLMGPNEPDGTMYTCVGFYDPEGGIPKPSPTRFIHAKAIYNLAVGNRTVRGNNNASGDENVAILYTELEFRGQSQGRPRYFGLCDVCFTEVAMSQNTLFHLRLHRGSQKCRKTRAKRIKEGEKGEVDAQLKEMKAKNGTEGPRWMPTTTPRDVPPLSHPQSSSAVTSSSSASYITSPSHPQAGPSSTPALKYVPAAQWAYSFAYPVPCAGIPLPWTIGSVYTTFPWSVFENADGKLGFHMVAVRNEEREIWVQATRCTGFRLPGQQECDACQRMRSLPTFRDLERRGQSPTKTSDGDLAVQNLPNGSSSAQDTHTSTTTQPSLLNSTFTTASPYRAQAASPQDGPPPDTPSAVGSTPPVEKDVSTDVECHQCGALIPVDMARNHVGFHLLRALVKYPEKGLSESVDPTEACGFCGFPGCSTTLDRPPPSRSYKVVSNCERCHRFNYHSAAKPSIRMPCTNIPMYCTLCPSSPATKKPPVLWKYAMFAHLRTTHPEHWDVERRCPRGLDEDMDALLSVSRDELEAIVSPKYVIPADAPVLLPYEPKAGVSGRLCATKSRTAEVNGRGGG